jgi:hypothetical protein
VPRQWGWLHQAIIWNDNTVTRIVAFFNVVIFIIYLQMINIVNLKNLKWLSLLDNKDLILEEEQKKWIQSLQNNGCKVFLEK